jgi:exonuclease III
LAVLWSWADEVAISRLITWNLNARLRQLPEQLAALTARTPDIVALQEVTKGRLDTPP